MKIGKKPLKITDKKLLYIITAVAAAFVIGVVALLLFLSGDEPPKPPSPPKELATRTLDTEREFALIGDGEKVITAGDVEAVYIMHIKDENRYLEIRFTEEGAEKFQDAIDDYESLSIMLDGEILVEGVVANIYYPQRARLDGSYATLMGYFNELT